jgi:hypothetical protein
MSKPGVDPTSGISSGGVMILPERHPACRRREPLPGSCTERENLRFDAKGKATSGSNREGEITKAGRRGGAARSSEEGPVMGLERRGCVVQPRPSAN